MTTLIDIYLERERDVRKLLREEVLAPSEEIYLVENGVFGGEPHNFYEEEFVKPILEINRQTLLTILKNEVERLEVEKLTAKNKGYDGNNLESACDFYHISAESWSEIIRYEDGYNASKQDTIDRLEGFITKLEQL